MSDHTIIGVQLTFSLVPVSSPVYVLVMNQSNVKSMFNCLSLKHRMTRESLFQPNF